MICMANPGLYLFDETMATFCRIGWQLLPSDGNSVWTIALSMNRVIGELPFAICHPECKLK